MFRNESDSAWKDILEAYLKDFLDYCLPTLSNELDWSCHWFSLDAEFQAIVKGESGKRLADKLFRVYRKDGVEQWILIHIEIQQTPEDSFPQRMFTYHYRIYDRYQKPIVSCAILTDSQEKWRPTSYEIGLGGSYIKSEFLVVKVIDYKDKIEELEKSNNPFASVILIQLEALSNQANSQDQRKKMKFALTKRLYEKNFTKTDIMNLYKFIDWLIGLPEQFEIEYLNHVYQIEGAKKMPYITSAERLGLKMGLERGMAEGIEKGMKKGIEKGIEKGIGKGIEKEKMIVARRLLTAGAELAFISKITELSLSQIEALQKEIA